MANSNHITAQADFLRCVSVFVRRFLATRSAGNTSCAQRVPAQYVVPAFPASVCGAPQAVPAGNSDHSTTLGRRSAWVATETIGDALERWYNLLGGGRGYGLYGGSFTASGAYYSYGPLVLRFRSTCFVANLKVSGTAIWNRTTSRLTARLRLTGPRGLTGSLRIRWPTSQQGAVAIETGVIDGHRVALQMRATFSAHG